MTESTLQEPQEDSAPAGKYLRFAVPLLIFSVIGTALGVGLTLDPKNIPSALIGKPVPVFDLPPVLGRTQGLQSSDLQGDIALLNVFASWCTACRAEHPLFMRLAREQTVPIHGLNYKDQPQDAAAWLEQLGDPYTRTGADINGRVGIEFGVYGVPETFVIGRDGRIAYKHIGPVTPDALTNTILPLVERLRESSEGMAQ